MKKERFLNLLRKNYWLILLLFITVVPRLLFFKTFCYAPPGIGSDAGMMAFEASQQSLMRNAGYPGFAIIAGIFEQFFPFSTDINLSLISFLSGIGSVVLIYLITNYLFKNKLIAFISALLFSTAPVSIYVNTSQEIYATQAFFFLLSLFMLTRAGINKKNLIFSGLVYGFSIAVHQSSLFAFPFLIIYYFWLNKLLKRPFKKEVVFSLFNFLFGVLISLLIIFSWMKFTTKLDYPKFINQFFGEFSAKMPASLQKAFGLPVVEIKQESSQSFFHSINWYKESWNNHLKLRLEVSFGKQLLLLYALSLLLALISGKILGGLLLLLIVSSLYLEFNPSPGGDNGRFIVMVGPAFVFTIALFLSKIFDFLNHHQKTKVKNSILLILLFSSLYIGFKGITSPWINEKGLKALYRARKIYYTWLGKNVPKNSYFVEDEFMPQDGEYYSGIKMIFDDGGNLGVIEEGNDNLYYKKRWQLTKLIDRFPSERFLSLLYNRVPLYAQKKTILARNLDLIPFSLNTYSPVKVYDNWNLAESKKFLQTWNCTTDSKSDLAVNKDNNLTISLLGKSNEVYENAICDIKNLLVNPEKISYLEIRFRMHVPSTTKESFENPPKTSLNINLYEKNKTDREYLYNTELPYSDNWQVFRINLLEETDVSEIDGLRIQLSNFWNRYFDGTTNLEIDYIKFSAQDPWYNIVEVDREPLTNLPLYQVLVNDNFFKAFKPPQLIGLSSVNNYTYIEDFSEINWLTDSADQKDIIKFNKSLTPARHLSPGIITYHFVSNTPLKSLSFMGKIFLGYYSQSSYFKIFVKRGNEPFVLASQIYSEERNGKEYDFKTDLSHYVQGSSDGYIRFELYSDGISKYRDRAGTNSVLKEFSFIGKPE